MSIHVAGSGTRRGARMNRLVRLSAALLLVLVPLTMGCRSAARRAQPKPSLTQAQLDALALKTLYEQAKSGEASLADGFALLRELYTKKRLGPALRVHMRQIAADHPELVAMVSRSGELVERIGAELCMRGLLPSCPAYEYEPWDKVTARIDAQVTAGERGDLANPETQKTIADLGGASWQGGNTIEMLIDGPASWAKRKELLEGATSQIDVLTWAFYDDPTGWDTAKALLRRAKEGIKVRVMVDGQIASKSSYGAVVNWLRERSFTGEDGGSLQVIGWRDPARRYDGQHRKMFIVDHVHLVGGGMNYGDWYSHQNPKEPQRWRDTDVYIQGPAALTASRLFHSLWIEQIKDRGLKMAYAPFPVIAPMPTEGGARVAVVSHAPGSDAHVLLSLLRAIEAANKTIDIESAYYVRIPPLASALARAVKRGVRVRLLTNSAESVDETLISNAILTSAKELSDVGGEVYLRRGSTLHSKFMVIDGVFSSIGSYNLHPRSYRMEGEVMFHILGEGPAGELTTAFENDLKASDRIVPGEPLEIPANPITAFALRFFPDQL